MKKLSKFDYEVLLKLLGKYADMLYEQDRLNTLDLLLTIKNIISYDREMSE